MSAPGNATSVSADVSPASPSRLLWIPYVLIALLFIVFLGANFWCYHRRHRERYLRKRDENRMKDGLHERRRITALMRSHFQSTFMSKHNSLDAGDDCEQSNDVKGAYPVLASYGPVSVRLSPAQPAAESSLWTGQYGSCAASTDVGDTSCTDHVLDNNNRSAVQ